MVDPKQVDGMQVILAAYRSLGVIRPGEMVSNDLIRAASYELDAMIANIHLLLADRLKPMVIPR